MKAEQLCFSRPFQLDYWLCLVRCDLEFNHIGAVKHLGTEHIGGFIHIDGADDEDILGQVYFSGDIFILVFFAFFPIPKFDGFSRFHGAEEIGKIAFHHAEVHFVENQEIWLGRVFVGPHQELQHSAFWFFVFTRLQCIWVAQQWFSVGPVSTYGNNAELIVNIFAQALGKSQCQLCLSRTRQPAEDNERLGHQRIGEALDDGGGIDEAGGEEEGDDGVDVKR